MPGGGQWCGRTGDPRRSYSVIGRTAPSGPVQAHHDHEPSGEVLAIGSPSDDRTLLASTEISDPRTRRFRAGPTTSAGRHKLAGAATPLPDGRVLVAGAGPGLEIIDPVRFTSHPVDHLAPVYAAFWTTSVLGADLRIVGGYDRSNRATHIDLTVPLSRL